VYAAPGKSNIRDWTLGRFVEVDEVSTTKVKGSGSNLIKNRICPQIA